MDDEEEEEGEEEEEEEKEAITEFRRSVAGFSARRPWFDPRPVHMGCSKQSGTGTWDSFLRDLSYPVSALHQCLILIHSSIMDAA